MAGVKGRSGRKSKTDEQKRLSIIDNAWDIVNEFLKSETHINEKVREAIKIVVRDMPQDPLVNVENHSHFVVFRNPKALEENGNSRENIKLSAR